MTNPETLPADAELLLDSQLCFPLYTAARQVVALYTPVLKPLGLTYTQYVVMLVLWEQHELSVGEIGRRLHLDSGTLTPLLKRMEAGGLVARSRSGSDERMVLIRLTERGEALKAQAAGIPRKIGACIPLQPEEAVTLYMLLRKVIGAGSERGQQP